MKIGLLSDTHGHLPAQVFDIFSDVDLIIHAGDICSETILLDLQALAPVKAVFGNMDRSPLAQRLPRVDFLKVENLMLCVTHIVNSKKNFAYEILKMGKKADLVIFGHTHMPEAKEFNKILFINPGSVVHPRSASGATVAILTVNDTKADVGFYTISGSKKGSS